jgi:uncharacterized protein YecT (DUF1311 family)
MITRLAQIAVLAALAACWTADEGIAQARAGSPKDMAAIRACAEKYAENVTEGERRCLFALVADPCAKSRGGRGPTECYRIEQEIWDVLLNENFGTLREQLDDDQKEKLRDMQRAWIAYRNSTCEFYYHKIQGSMATSMTAACLARETARRALLLKFFQGL